MKVRRCHLPIRWEQTNKLIETQSCKLLNPGTCPWELDIFKVKSLRLANQCDHIQTIHNSLYDDPGGLGLYHHCKCENNFDFSSVADHAIIGATLIYVQSNCWNVALFNFTSPLVMRAAAGHSHSLLVSGTDTPPAHPHFHPPPPSRAALLLVSPTSSLVTWSPSESSHESHDLH